MTIAIKVNGQVTFIDVNGEDTVRQHEAEVNRFINTHYGIGEVQTSSWSYV